MDRKVDDIRRRTWAPFVGAALAALTAGSLVVFSLVAQRTSLDGFPELRIAAPAEAATGRPASITVAPLETDTTGTRSSDDDAVSRATADISGTGTAPLTLIPFVPATTPDAPVELATLNGPASSPLSVARSPQPRADAEIDFDGRFRADGVVLASSRNPNAGKSGPGSNTAGDDARRDRKHAHKSHHAKSKKSKKHGRAGRSQGSRATGASGYRGRPSFAGSGSDGSHGASSAPRSKPSPQGPPAHSNAGGNGKSRGKGHRHN